MADAEVTALLLRAFTHLRQLSTDPRPEVRNSACRTLFAAVGGQAARGLDAGAWRYVLWEVLLPLATYAHLMGDTSSSQEAAPAELGRERGGKAVVMLVHHSRNTEQKQWCAPVCLVVDVVVVGHVIARFGD